MLLGIAKFRASVLELPALKWRLNNLAHCTSWHSKEYNYLHKAALI